MSEKRANAWDSSRVDFYIREADVVVLERKQTIKLVVDIFGYHFAGRDTLRLLDLGCGDGVLSVNINARHKGHSYHLLDSSGDMLAKARENLQGVNATFIAQAFEEYVSEVSSGGAYDFVFSAHAIHHLDALGKQALYRRIFAQLNPGGLFLNYGYSSSSFRAK